MSIRGSNAVWCRLQCRFSNVLLETADSFSSSTELQYIWFDHAIISFFVLEKVLCCLETRGHTKESKK